MYSVKYFLFYEIDVHLYNGATVKLLSVSESNPGSLCKIKWQQWCYWCKNRGDKENAWFGFFRIFQKLSLIYNEILAMTSWVLAETIIESLVLAFFTMYIFFHEGFWT